MFRARTRDWVVFLNIGGRSLQLYTKTGTQLKTMKILWSAMAEVRALTLSSNQSANFRFTYKAVLWLVSR